MYSKKRTLADNFTLNNKMIDIPRDAVIDKIMMWFSATLKNADDTDAWTGKKADLLKKIGIRLVSDGNTVHYALTALDLAIMNFYEKQGVTINPDDSVMVQAGGETVISGLLVMDAGDILAITKDSLEMSLEFNTSMSGDPAVRIDDFTGKITIEENIYSTPAEFMATYGQNRELSAEPKVTTIVKSFESASELRETLELPTGTLLRKGYLVFADESEEIGGMAPDTVGLIKTTPDRTEAYRIDYPTLREVNKDLFILKELIDGVSVLDYGAEITNDVFGIRGWTYNKGDYQLSLKSSEPGKLRYISVEYVVNTQAFTAASNAIIERT